MRERRSAGMGRGKRRAALAAMAVLVGVAAPALVFAVTSELPVFGMLGLGRGRAAVLHLVLVHPPNPLHPGCRVTASFVDARGQVFHDRAGNPVEQTFALRDNVAAALTLRAADILATGETRKPIRAVLTDPPDDGTPSDCTCLVATEEIVGASGRTDLSIYGQRPPGGGNPPPPPICTLPTR